MAKSKPTAPPPEPPEPPPAATPAPAGPDLEAIAEALAAPFPEGVVHWKPQTIKENRALVIAFIDARDVQDRLDDVLGVMGWQDSYEPLPDGAVVCRLQVRIGSEWITKEDVGGQSEQPDEGDRRKAAFSDAIKRAAVKFGVGRYLYRLKPQWVDYDHQKRRIVGTPALPDAARPAPPKPAAPVKPPPPPANGKAPPKDGREFLARLQQKDADLAAEGLCSPGDLLAVVGRAGRERKIDAKLSDWQPDAFPIAFAAVKEFETEARKALPPLAQRIDDIERPLVEAGACGQDDLARHVAYTIGADFSDPTSWPASAGAKAFRAAREFVAEARHLRVVNLLAAKGREWADACKMCGVDCDADVAQLPDHEFAAAVTILSALPDAKGRDAGVKKKQLQGAS